MDEGGAAIGVTGDTVCAGCDWDGVSPDGAAAGEAEGGALGSLTADAAVWGSGCDWDVVSPDGAADG